MATRPATEPRIRLLTIFISTSKLLCGKVPDPLGVTP
jgi:hypothetical protein